MNSGNYNFPKTGLTDIDQEYATHITIMKQFMDDKQLLFNYDLYVNESVKE